MCTHHWRGSKISKTLQFAPISFPSRPGETESSLMRQQSRYENVLVLLLFCFTKCSFSVSPSSWDTRAKTDQVKSSQAQGQRRGYFKKIHTVNICLSLSYFRFRNDFWDTFESGQTSEHQVQGEQNQQFEVDRLFSLYFFDVTFSSAAWGSPSASWTPSQNDC